MKDAHINNDLIGSLTNHAILSKVDKLNNILTTWVRINNHTWKRRRWLDLGDV